MKVDSTHRWDFIERGLLAFLKVEPGKDCHEYAEDGGGGKEDRPQGIGRFFGCHFNWKGIEINIV